MRRVLVVALTWLVVATVPALVEAQGMAGMGMEGTAMDMPMPLITNMAMPMNWAELMVMHADLGDMRMYQAFPNIQYVIIPRASLQLTVPVTVLDPKMDEPTVGGIGDIDLTGRYAVLLLGDQQFVLTGALTLSFPTGDEDRGLGGEWAIAPAILVGKQFGPLTLQAEARYRFRLDSPEGDGEKDQIFFGNVAAHYAFIKGFGGLLELNTVTPVQGEREKKTEVYITPGVWAEPVKGLNVRAGVQIPVTDAKAFDYNVVVAATWQFR